MKNYLLYCFFLLTAAISSGQTTADEEQLKDLVQGAFDSVLSDMDLESIPDYFTDDFVLLEAGEVWDIPKLKSMLDPEGMTDVKRINDFEFIQININGESAWLAYHNKATYKKANETISEINWLESATAIKTKDGWRMEMLHSTRKPKAD